MKNTAKDRFERNVKEILELLDLKSLLSQKNIDNKEIMDSRVENARKNLQNILLEKVAKGELTSQDAIAILKGNHFGRTPKELEELKQFENLLFPTSSEIKKLAKLSNFESMMNSIKLTPQTKKQKTLSSKNHEIE